MSRKLDILIVGAGLSGLAAAIQCAISGHSVTVLEGARELAEVRTLLYQDGDADLRRSVLVCN